MQLAFQGLVLGGGALDKPFTQWVHSFILELIHSANPHWAPNNVCTRYWGWVPNKDKTILILLLRTFQSKGENRIYTQMTY